MQRGKASRRAVQFDVAALCFVQEASVGLAGAWEHGAILYTLIESCRIDPSADLLDILTRLPAMKNHQIPEVTPAAWTKTLKKAAQTKS